MTTKLENKVRALEGLVLANRYGARTIWNGFLITVISSLALFAVLVPIMILLSQFTTEGDEGKMVVSSDGQGVLIAMLVVVVAYYAAMIVGAVKMVVGFYRMSHPEKYADKMLEEEAVK